MKSVLFALWISFAGLSSAFAGMCVPQNPNDSAAGAICQSSGNNRAVCLAQGIGCAWIDNGFCAPQNPQDAQHRAVCSRISTQRACLANSAFCYWYGGN